jgi:hypothetical protein
MTFLPKEQCEKAELSPRGTLLPLESFIVVVGRAHCFSLAETSSWQRA